MELIFVLLLFSVAGCVVIAVPEHLVLVYPPGGTLTTQFAIHVTNRETRVSHVHSVIGRIGRMRIGKWSNVPCVISKYYVFLRILTKTMEI